MHQGKNSKTRIVSMLALPGKMMQAMIKRFRWLESIKEQKPKDRLFVATAPKKVKVVRTASTEAGKDQDAK